MDTRDGYRFRVGVGVCRPEWPVPKGTVTVTVAGKFARLA